MSSIDVHSSPFDTKERLEKRFKDREDEYFTYEQFYVLIGTFNVNNRTAPATVLLDEWIYRQIENSRQFPDIIAVGFQEIDTSGGAYIYDDRKKEEEWDQIIRRTIQSSYKSKDDKNRFKLLNRVRLMGILLFVYVREKHMSKCTSVSRNSVPTGFMGIAGNKGGVGIRFRFYETDICFINCHFASGDGQTQRRNEDYQAIESRMTFSDVPSYSLTEHIWYTPTTLASAASATISSSTPSPTGNSWKINEHDIVFWFGDMNYRIAHGNELVRRSLLEKSTLPLREKDQLRIQMKSKLVFIGYAEAPIDFLPTYKYDVGTDTYDSSEKARIPSWTDRILYHARRTKVRANGDLEIATIQPMDYLAAKQIRFSDHRPVSSLFIVTMKSVRDDVRAHRIREELIRQIDREENDAIPVIEVHPRAPAIRHDNLRYLDKVSYSLDIKNTGEYRCTVSLYPPSIARPNTTIRERGIVEDPFFECLSLVPSSPYSLEPGDKQTINISFQMKSKYIWLFGKQLNEILILHVTNGADTFITLDITLDMGPFGLAFSQFPPTLYDTEKKQHAYSVHSADHLIEMKNDPPALYLALIECLKTRHDLNLFQIFNSEVQDSLDLRPIRNQIYQHNYQFDAFSTTEVFMILLHLLQSLPEPLISREIQDRIFLSTNHSSHSSYLPSGGSIQSHIPSNQHTASSQQDMNKAVAVIFEQLKPKERNLFCRFLSLLQKTWPTSEQIRQFDHDRRNALKMTVEILALSILHNYADPQQRDDILLACLKEKN